MKKIIIFTIIFSCILVFSIISIKNFEEQQEKEPKLIKETNKIMKIRSSVFINNQLIPSKYTCDGENTSPPLTIFNVPKETKSLVLIMDDPYVPAGIWVHWLVWNISPKTSEIPEGFMPAGANEGVTSFGKISYGGPCPPFGTHRYFFKLYALDTRLDLVFEKITKNVLEQAMENHIIAKAELVGRYKRL